MSNFIFPKLASPKLNSWMFSSLKGISIPFRDEKNPGNVGIYLDNHIKTNLNISNHSTTVDLSIYGIEIKSKELSTRTDWSIGSMTLNDIVNTPYNKSSVYEKLQALLLITTNDTFLTVKDVGLYYFDNDEIQLLLEKSYEEARFKICSRVAQHASWVKQQINNGNPTAVLTPVKFSSFEKFHGEYGKFEYTNNGTSFMFRISVPQMRHLTTLAACQSELYHYE